MLEPLLGVLFVPSPHSLLANNVNVNHLAKGGCSARVLAIRSGNAGVAERVPLHPNFYDAWEVLPELFWATGGRDGAWRESLGWCTNKPLRRWKGVVVVTVAVVEEGGTEGDREEAEGAEEEGEEE